ncbi:MAG: PQQ-binding-like beta-propeller repeat protein, partial [Chloroflexi bacterium]|nr:PQQ-binding-like beta-propeller repeat protein [Chloroflexota bacterium]
SPLKITQSRYPRKIRIFSSTPLVKEGIVYHCTNAGVVAAVDARTGDIRWLTRYPQNKNALDNFSSPGLVWRNEPPLVRGNKLFVTPVDSSFLLCLDTETGRILWVTTRNRDSSWPDRGARGFPNAWRMAGFIWSVSRRSATLKKTPHRSCCARPAASSPCGWPTRT